MSPVIIMNYKWETQKKCFSLLSVGYDGNRKTFAVTICILKMSPTMSSGPVSVKSGDPAIGHLVNLAPKFRMITASCWIQRVIFR